MEKITEFKFDNLQGAITKFYSEVSRVIQSQTNDKDIGLQLFQDHVVQMNRQIMPMIHNLGNKSIEKWFQELNPMDIFKYEFPRVGQAAIPAPPNEMNQGCGEQNVQPSKKELKESEYHENKKITPEEKQQEITGKPPADIKPAVVMKAKIYFQPDKGEKAPEGVEVHRGSEGGVYYYSETPKMEQWKRLHQEEVKISPKGGASNLKEVSGHSKDFLVEKILRMSREYGTSPVAIDRSRSSVVEALDFIDFYIRLANDSKNILDSELDKVSMRLIKGMENHFQSLRGRGYTKLANKIDAFFRNKEGTNFYTTLKYGDRPEKIIAIDKFVSIGHSVEPTIIPHVFGVDFIGVRIPLQFYIVTVLDFLAGEEQKMDKWLLPRSYRAKYLEKQYGSPLPYTPEEDHQQQESDVNRPLKIKEEYKKDNPEQAPIESRNMIDKEFQKLPEHLVEGEKAHSLRMDVLHNDRNRLGEKQEVISGEIEKAAFSPDAPKTDVKQKEKDNSYIERNVGREYVGKQSPGSFSTQKDTYPEVENQITPARKDKGGEAVTENKEACFEKGFNPEDDIYKSIDDLLQGDFIEKMAHLIQPEVKLPLGTKAIAEQAELELYSGLRNTITNWFVKLSLDKGVDVDEALTDLKLSLMKWNKQEKSQIRNSLQELYNRGLEAGIRQTGIPVQKQIKKVDYVIYKDTGIAPAIDRFRDDSFNHISKILRKHQEATGYIAPYRTKRDIDSWLHDQRYQTRRMLKTEVAKISNWGMLKAWEEDDNRFHYNYFWNSIIDDSTKRISKMRFENNPYSFPELEFLWKHQKQLIGKTLEDDSFNQRCYISRQPVDYEFKSNRFVGQEFNFRRTLPA